MESRKHFEMLVKMRPHDYLPIPFIAEMLGTDESEIRRQIKLNFLPTLPLSRKSFPKVKRIDSDTPYYVFRDGIRALVKVVETRESMAIFEHLCDRADVVRAVVKRKANADIRN